MSSVLQSSVPYHHITVLHRFFWVVQSLLFHGSVSTIKHLLRFLPHFDNSGLRNVFFVYVLYLLVVEYFRKSESSLDAISMIYLILLSTCLCKCHRAFSHVFLVRVQASEPYNKTDSTTDLKKFLFKVVLSGDFHMELNMSRAS